MSENLRFEAYLEALGIAKGASIPYRRDMIAAMYHTACICCNGYSMPIFPVAKLKRGWIGWLGGEPDRQASEGWPFSPLATRHVARKWERQRKHDDGSVYTRRFESDAVEVMMPERFNYIAETLRFLHRHRAEDRAALVAGFCEAVGRTRASAAWLTEQLDLAERVFTKAVKDGAALEKYPRWRKLAKELGL